jgi:two-component system nitrate/nitrite response regulator NarL
MSDSIKILVIDDHPLLRDGVCSTLESEEDFKVVAQGASYDDAMQLAKEHLPDIIFLDISMPGGGVNAAREIHSSLPNIKLVMLTVSEDEKDVLSALQAGASGYILKGIGGKELINAVHTISRGETFINAGLAASILLNSSHQGVDTPSSPQNKLDKLNKRESSILKALERGLTNKQIADELFLSEKTIKHYMTSIMQKLEVKNRVEAALMAQKYERGD